MVQMAGMNLNIAAIKVVGQNKRQKNAGICSHFEDINLEHDLVDKVASSAATKRKTWGHRPNAI